MSLELKGTVTGNVRKYEAHADKTNDGKTATVLIDIDLDEAQAKKLGGQLFATTCFSGFVGGSGATVVDTIKLGGELKIKSEHTIEIQDIPLVAKPSIDKVEMGSEARLVTAKLKLKVLGTSKKLRKLLDDSVGDDLKLKFKGVTQLDLEQPKGPRDEADSEASS